MTVFKVGKAPDAPLNKLWDSRVKSAIPFFAF